MPIYNSGKLFQVRSKTEKSRFLGKGYSGIGPAKRAITAEHRRALARKRSGEGVIERIRNGIQTAWDTAYALEFANRSLVDPWLDPHNFEIVEFQVIEKTVHEYTPPT